MNVRNEQRINELIEIASKMNTIEIALLIFRTNSSDNSNKYFNIVHAYLLHKCKVIDVKLS